MMARVKNRVKYNEDNPRWIEQPTCFVDHSLYEVSFPNFRRNDMTVNAIAENMLS